MKKILLLLIIKMFFLHFLYAQNYQWSNFISSTNRSVPVALSSNDDAIHLLHRSNAADTIHAQNGVSYIVNRGSFDSNIIKFDLNGNIIWERTIGGTGNEQAYNLLVDNSNNIYVIGGFTQTVYFGPDYIANLVSTGDEDAFFAKYSENGDLLAYKTIISGNGRDRVSSSTFNQDSTEILVTGFIRNGTATFNNAAGSITTASQKVFYGVLDLNGDFSYINEFFECSNTSSTSSHIKYYDDNNIYIAGSLSSSSTISDGYGFVKDVVMQTADDGFLMKLTKNGVIEWVQILNNASLQKNLGLSIDADGNPYYSLFASSNLTITSETENNEEIVVPVNSLIVVKYNTDGNYVWNYRNSGNAVLKGSNIEIVDKFIYITCDFSNTMYIGADTIVTNGGADANVHIIDTSGNVYGGFGLGGNSTDGGLYINKTGNNLLFTGVYVSETLEIETDVINNYSSNRENTFITKTCPPIRFIGLENAYCNGAGSTELKGHPVGGVFSGTGVLGGVFNPSGLETGIYPVTYTYSNVPAGCATSHTTYAKITETPEITGLQAEYCEEDAPIVLSATPTGGVFTIDGIVATDFDPTTLAPGDYEVKYSYTSPGTTCEDVAIQNVKINPLPTVSFSSLADVCINGDSVNLSGSVMPIGSSFSGTGVNNNYFNPSVALTGTHTITYSYTDAKGCTNTANQDIEVNDTTGVWFYPISAQCENSPSVLLSDFVTFTGGTFDGEGVVGSRFYPDIAEAVTSPHEIEYVFTNEFGCKDTSLQTIEVNSVPSAIAGASETSIAYSTSTQLMGNGAGGSGVYSYLWSPSESIADATTDQNPNTDNLTESTIFSLEVTDDNNCVSTPSNITINVLGGTMSLSAVNDEVCPLEEAQLDVLVSGGTGNFSYQWSPTNGLSNPTIKNPTVNWLSSTTTYKVVVTDIDALESDSVNVTITVLPTPTLSVSATDSQICFDKSTQIKAEGTLASYFWDNSLGAGAEHTISPTVTTTYNVTATASNGCTSTDNIEIEVLDLPIINANVTESEICLGAEVTLSANSSIANTTYEWSDGNNSLLNLDVSPFSTTTYYVTGTDENGCVGTDNIQVTVNQLPNISISAISTTICEGLETVLSASGADSYEWSDGTNPIIDLNVQPIVSTTYYVTGTTAATGCENENQIYIEVKPKPAITFNNATPNPVCENEALSQRLDLLVTPTGGTFSGTGVSNSGSRWYFYPAIATSEGSPHTISYTYTGANGCSNTASQDIHVNPLPQITFDAISPMCENATPVSLVATPEGGTFSGTGVNETNFNPSVSGSGNFNISYTYTDGATGCVNVASQTVTVYAVPVVVAASDVDICPEETALVSVSGNAISYTWDNGLGEGTAHQVSPNSTTVYTVTGINSNNCSVSDNMTVTVNPTPDLLNVSADFSEMCIGDINTPTLTASGADSYSWDNNLGTGAIKNINPTQTTTYTVTGANSFNCTNTASVEIVVNPLPTVIASSDISICDGSTGNISVTGNASTYTWSESLDTGTNKTVSPIVETTYTVTGESLAGCFNTDNVTVSINNLPIVTFNSLVNNPICENSEINERIDGLVNPFGGIFNGNGVVASGSEVYFYPELATASTSPHTITYSYTDANGCTNSASQIVTVNEVPSINFDVVAPICIDNSPITLSATPIGGIFSGVGVDGNTFDPSVSGSGSINVNYSYTDLNGCSNIKEQNITVNPLPSVVFGTINDLCLSNPPIDLTGHALPLGGTYSGLGVNSSTSIFDPEVAGVNYTPGHIINYSYTDANGCTSDSDQYLLVKDDPNIVWDDIPTAVCLNDNVVTLSATPIGGVFSGNGVVGNQFYPSLAGAGTNNLITYTYYDFPGTGCSAVSTYYIRVNDVPLVATSDDITICEGLSADISVTGNALTYNWSNGLGNGTTKTVTPSTSTTYTVTAVSSEGCEISDIVTVNVVSKPNVYASSDVEICNGNSTQLSVLGNAASYTWSTSEQTSFITVSPTATTTYTVVGTTLEGCENSDNVIVTVNPIPYILASTTNPEFCIGNSTLLNASGASTYVWDNNLGAGANKTVSPTVATTYNVLGTDLKGCVGQGSVTINVNPRPTVNAGDDIILCKTDTALVTATSNTTDLIWNNGLGSGASHNVSPTTTTVYTVTATDENGCTSTDNIEVTVYNKPSISITPSSSNVCEGSSVSLSVSGALNYVWSNNLGTSNTINVTPSAETTYSVTGTDSRGCSNIASSTIGIKPVPSVSISAIDTTVCKGVSTYVKAHGANSYVWNNNLSSIEENLITPIVSTTYSVTGTNSYGCSSTGQLTINVKELPTALASAERTRINYGAQANLLGFVSGGTGTEYEYLWTPSNLIENSDTIQNPTSISMSESNIFTLVATDEFGCESNQSSIIINVEGGAMSIIPLGDEICAGNKADLTVLTSGGSGEFEYSWEPSELLEDANVFNPKSFELLETTEFTVLVKDTQTNDTRTSTVLVLVNQLPIVDASGDVAVCSGAELQMSVAGNANSYLWSNGLGYGETKTIVATNSIAYIVTGVDSNACVNTDTVFINTYQSPTEPEIIVDGNIPFCLGDSVKLKVETIEGHTYNWSNNVEADSIYISESGQYSVMAFDENGCESQNSETIFAYNITPPQQPTISVVGATTICYGDTVELSSSSGVNYLWSNGSEQQTIFVINGGEYSVRISDNNGCVSEYSEIVEVSTMFAPEKPLLSVSGNIDLCFGAEQIISAPEGYSYLWSNGETGSSIAVTESGEYFVQISDNGSCLSIESDTAIVNFEMISTSISASETEVCFGTEVQLSATGGTEYLWSDGNHGDTIYYDAQLSGYVYVTVTDGECVGIDSVYISVIPGVYVNLGNNINVCEGNRVTLGSVEGDEILWSTGETSETISFIPTQTDVYKVTVSSGICSASDSVIVNLIPNPIIDLGEDVSICEGQSIELQIEDGYEYSWSTGDTTTSITVSQSGNYVVTATNNGCEVYDNILVTVIQNPIIDMIAENPDCGEANGSVTLDITTQGSDLTYLWNSFPQDLLDNVNTTGDKLENIASGLYSVVVTDGECSSFAEMILNDEVINTPITGVYSNKETVCRGEEVELTVEGDAWTLMWYPREAVTPNSGNRVTARPTQTTTYHVFATVGGCTVSESITINVDQPPVFDLQSNVSFCDGESIIVDAGQFDSYLWSNGSNSRQISISQEGLYSVTVTDGVCSVFDTLMAIKLPKPLVSIETVNANCGSSNGSIEIEALDENDEYFYLWENGLTSNSLFDIASGTYNVEINNSDCSINHEVLISDSDGPNVNIVASKQEILLGESVILEVTGADTYNWNLTSDMNLISYDEAVVSPSQTTTYSVEGVFNGCKSLASITIDVITNLDVNIGEDITVCEGEVVTLSSNIEGNYIWSNGSTSPSINVTQSGIYSLTVTQNQAIGYDYVRVSVLPIPKVELSVFDASCGETDGMIVASTYDLVDYMWSNNTINDTLQNVEAGIYTLTVSNTACSSEYEILIKNADVEPISLIANKTQVCLGEELAITTNENISINWSNSENDISITSDTLVVAPLQTTMYYGSIENSNGCERFGSIEIEVVNYPQSELPVSSTICLGGEVTLNAGPYAQSYMWSDGNTNQTINVSSPGTYSVTLSNGACSIISSTTISEIQGPELVASFVNPSCGMSNGQISLNVNGGQEPYTYSWNTTPTQSGSVVSNIPAGIYTVRVSDASCTIRKDIQLANVGAPVLSLSSNSQTICHGNSANVTVSGANEYIWRIKSGDFITSTRTLEVSPTQTTSYIVEGQVDGCKSYAEFKVNVNSLPQLSFVGLPTSICEGSNPISLNALPTGGIFKVGSTQTLVLDPSIIPNTVNVTYDYTNPITGCRNYIASAVTKLSAPEVEITNSSTNICNFADLRLYASPTGGSFYINGTPQSSFDASTISTHGQTFDVEYRYTNPNNGCVGIANKEFTKFSTPIANFTYYAENGKVGFVNQSLNANTYLWNFGGGVTSRLEDPEHTFAQSGNQAVSLVAYNPGCQSTLLSRNILITTDISENKVENSFVLTPNPTKGLFELQYVSSYNGLVNIEITSISGAEIEKTSIFKSKDLLSIYFDLSNITKGIYNVKIIAGEYIETKQIIVY